MVGGPRTERVSYLPSRSADIGLDGEAAQRSRRLQAEWRSKAARRALTAIFEGYDAQPYVHRDQPAVSFIVPFADGSSQQFSASYQTDSRRLRIRPVCDDCVPRQLPHNLVASISGASGNDGLLGRVTSYESDGQGNPVEVHDFPVRIYGLADRMRATDRQIANEMDEAHDFRTFVDQLAW